MEQLTRDCSNSSQISSKLILSKKTASRMSWSLTAPMIFKKTTQLGQVYYEVTRAEEVDKNLVEPRGFYREFSVVTLFLAVEIDFPNLTSSVLFDL